MYGGGRGESFARVMKSMDSGFMGTREKTFFRPQRDAITQSRTVRPVKWTPPRGVAHDRRIAMFGYPPNFLWP